MLSKAQYKKQLLDYTCIIEKNGQFTRYTENGIKPLLIHLQNSCFTDAIIYDKVIGKAASLLMVYGNAKRVYTQIISVPAIQVFIDNGVYCEYELCVENIINRAKTDICPMEKLCLGISNPNEAYKVLSERC